RVKVFQQGLRDLGWSEPRNIQIDYRFVASNPDLIKKYVAEVVNLAPDVIVGSSTPVIAALRRATSSIPIVFASLNDPVGQGFISSLAHPGEDEVERSFRRPCRRQVQADSRTHLIHRPARDIIPPLGGARVLLLLILTGSHAAAASLVQRNSAPSTHMR